MQLTTQIDYITHEQLLRSLCPSFSQSTMHTDTRLENVHIHDPINKFLDARNRMCYNTQDFGHHKDLLKWPKRRPAKGIASSHGIVRKPLILLDFWQRIQLMNLSCLPNMSARFHGMEAGGS